MAGALAPITDIYSFGLFEADAAHNVLTRSGVRVKIQDQPFRVLVLLVERAGEIVTREELRHALWPEGTFVDFEGSLNVVIKKLRAAIDDDSGNPRFIETVPRQGYRFIAPVSKKCARAAVPSNGQAQVPSPAEPAAVGPISSWRSGRSYRLFYTALILASIFAMGATWLVWHKRQRLAIFPRVVSSPVQVPVPVRQSVAVLGLHNASSRSNDAWLGTAFCEMLNTELAGGEALRLVSGEDVANLRSSFPWPQTDSLDRTTTARIGRALNSDLLVLGSYTVLGASPNGQVRFDVRLQDAKSGDILTEIAETGSRQELFQIVSRVGAKLRERLGIPLLENTEQAGVIAALPLDPEVAKFYSLGVTRLRQFDALAAKDLLQQAVKADPKFSLAHAMLARAWAQLGYEQKHKEEAKKALDLSADLPRAERMLVEGEYYESLGDQEKAASLYHALFVLFPDNVEYGLRLAKALYLAGHTSQSLEVLHQLRNLPSSFSDDPRIDLLQSRMAGTKTEALKLIQSALTKASSHGQRLLYAQAKDEECMNLVYGGHPNEGAGSCKEAYSIFMAAGNRLFAADCLRLIADHFGGQGQLNEAIANYQAALNILRELGEHEKTGAVLNNMGEGYLKAGKLNEAEKVFYEAKQDFEESGDRYNAAIPYGNIAEIHQLRGDLGGAASIYQHVLAIENSLDISDPSSALASLAEIELARGHPEISRRHAQHAIDRPTQVGFDVLVRAMIVLARALESEGDLAGARQELQNALAFGLKTNQADAALNVQVALAELDVQQRHCDEAELRLRGAISEFEKNGEIPGSSLAHIVLSRALLMQGKVDAAREAARKGAELSLASNNPALKLAAATEQARIEIARAGAKNQPMAAPRLKLLSAISNAHNFGYFQLECEARIALDELEMRTNPAEARNQLSSLSNHAHERGLELIAQQAEQVIAAGGHDAALSKHSHTP